MPRSARRPNNGGRKDVREKERRARSGENPGGVEARLQELLQGLVSRKGVAHAVVAVESGDRAFRWIGAAGHANPSGTLMQDNTPYFIASVTKLYIASTILKLHERGELTIDHPMTAYLPPRLIQGLHRLNGTDHTGRITLRHLLGHASGLPEYLEYHPKGEKSLLERVIENQHSWTLEDTLQIVRDKMKPYFEPQPLQAKRWKVRYSDTNYQLLIGIIEAVVGKPVAEVFDELLFRPLELKDTFHPEVAASRTGLEPATVWAEDKPLEPAAMTPFRDLYSTASDQLRFMQALRSGEVFANPTTRELMSAYWNTFGFLLSPVAPGWPIQYGLGMMRFQLPRLFSPFWPMPPIVGHTGATGSWLFYCPKLDMVLCGTVDQITAAAVPFNVVPQLLRVLESSKV